MFGLFQGYSNPLSDQDVEMGIDRQPAHDVTQPSTNTTSYLPVPPQNGTETPEPPYQHIEPEALTFIEKQKEIIDSCMAQVSH